MDQTTLVNLVRQVCSEFCAELTQDEVSKFVRYTRLVTLEPEQVLADIGARGESFFMVIGGAIGLYQVTEQSSLRVGAIGGGGLVGEMSFFDKRPRTLRLAAMSDGAQLLEISRRMYNRLVLEEPYVTSKLLEFVIRSLDSLVRDMSEKTATLYRSLNVAEVKPAAE